MRIVFIGTPGSGKTTLAAAVFSELKRAGRSVEHVDEFVRRDIAAHGKMTSIWEQYRTRQHQRELEDTVPKNVKYIVCDSGTISPYFYACLYADPNEPRQRVVLQDMYRYLLDDLYLRRYDLIFYLPPLVAPDLNDGVRYQTEQEIATLDAHMNLLFTKIHNLPEVHRVSSAMDQRLEEVMWKILSVGEPSMSHEEFRGKVITLIDKLRRPTN